MLYCNTESLPWSLDELLKSVEPLSCYEIKGRELILYLSGMHMGDSSALDLKPIEVLAVVPGQFTGPAGISGVPLLHPRDQELGCAVGCGDCSRR